MILDPHEDKTVPTGELGEIGIAGVGLALGYMNRDDLTMKKFIRDFLHIENNPSGRIYRTGDLGRIDENGEIDYRGRIDTQVKIPAIASSSTKSKRCCSTYRRSHRPP